MEAEHVLRDLVAGVRPVDEAAHAAALARQTQLTKPPGSLGRLEELSACLAAIAGRCPPPVPAAPVVIVAAADHGVLEQGVSPWPREVTAAMVAAFCDGKAAINQIARSVGAEVVVLDVGVASDLEAHPRLHIEKVRRGTGDLAQGPAMSLEEAMLAMLAGAKVASTTIEAGCDLLVTGDMGIANTTAAACLIASSTGAPAERVTGRGTGIDDATWEIKVKVVARALELHGPDPGDPVATLAAVGGLEHAALAGAILAAAARRVPVIIDGVSSNAAALVAVAQQPLVRSYLIAGHLSSEPGARIALEHLHLDPLLDLSMRLGEGTGGALAVPIVRAAAATLGGMATFDEAGIG